MDATFSASEFTWIGHDPWSPGRGKCAALAAARSGRTSDIPAAPHAFWERPACRRGPEEVFMDRRSSWTLRVLVLTVAGASLAGCAVYPARPYGHGGGYGYRPYAYSAPAWGGGRGHGYGYGGGGYGYGRGYGGGWR
jgi:hypothetical protein